MTNAHGNLSALLENIDDWCGKKPQREFPPENKKDAIRDLLVAVTIHNLAERMSNENIRKQIQLIAGGFFEAAGERIEGSRPER